MYIYIYVQEKKLLSKDVWCHCPRLTVLRDLCENIQNLLPTINRINKIILEKLVKLANILCLSLKEKALHFYFLPAYNLFRFNLSISHRIYCSPLLLLSFRLCLLFSLFIYRSRLLPADRISIKSCAAFRGIIESYSC